MYQIRCQAMANKEAREFAAATGEWTMDKWHQPLDYPNHKV